ncbi:hypothetical protein NE237_015581 [Protea cynaroides]|uniref:Uncharacterized protein n=1 Tax=Protea cynaroides TaxID=273540 RepID=A0A9Q0QR76_9MAGN|nr:hypothetical protein NE237_015581 [Protea cynaroides]
MPRPRGAEVPRCRGSKVCSVVRFTRSCRGLMEPGVEGCFAVKFTCLCLSAEECSIVRFTRPCQGVLWFIFLSVVPDVLYYLGHVEMPRCHGVLRCRGVLCGQVYLVMSRCRGVLRGKVYAIIPREEVLRC